MFVDIPACRARILLEQIRFEYLLTIDFFFFQLQRKKELTDKRNAKIRAGGWLPPHGERQFNLLRHMAREDQAPLSTRYEEVDKKKYLEEIMANKSPHYK